MIVDDFIFNLLSLLYFTIIFCYTQVKQQTTVTSAGSNHHTLFRHEILEKNLEIFIR